jgi:hypothetical protein
MQHIPAKHNLQVEFSVITTIAVTWAKKMVGIRCPCHKYKAAIKFIIPNHARDLAK